MTSILSQTGADDSRFQQLQKISSARPQIASTIPVVSEEIRVTDPDTGAQKGSKIERYDLIPTEPLRLLARHYGIGSKKYDDRNWEKGYNWSLSYAALQRHANAFWGGEDIDEETGQPHIIAVAWHAFALAEFMNTNQDKDDRSDGSSG